MRRSIYLFNKGVFAEVMNTSRHQFKDLIGEAKHLHGSVQKEIQKLALRPDSDITTREKTNLKALIDLEVHTTELLKKITGAPTGEVALTVAVHAIKPALSEGEARHKIDALTDTYERLMPKHSSFTFDRT